MAKRQTAFPLSRFQRRSISEGGKNGKHYFNEKPNQIAMNLPLATTAGVRATNIKQRGKRHAGGARRPFHPPGEWKQLLERCFEADSAELPMRIPGARRSMLNQAKEFFIERRIRNFVSFAMACETSYCLRTLLRPRCRGRGVHLATKASPGCSGLDALAFPLPLLLCRKRD